MAVEHSAKRAGEKLRMAQVATSEAVIVKLQARDGRNRLTIWDLKDLDADEALKLAMATLARFPVLGAIYDEPFLRDLIRRRATIVDNRLLLLLVQPEDADALAVWREISDDLILLKPEGSIAAFRHKLRQYTSAEVESARTEIALPAWFKRQGVAVVLEPQVGEKRADFGAETEPPTTWEIKSLQDIEGVQRIDAIERDVQGRLRKAVQPYVLSTTGLPKKVEQIASAVKKIVHALVEHDRANLPIPHEFEADGLVVVAEARGPNGAGFPGIFEGPMHVFDTEYSDRVRGRIRAALDQLPNNSAGIVAIDCTGATWLDDEDVIDACFGDLSTVVQGTKMFEVRKDGIFREGSYTRISAVVAYQRRRYVADVAPFSMTVLHNPFARFPLPAEWLVGDNMRHLFRIETKPGRYHFGPLPVARPESTDETDTEPTCG